MIGPLVKHFFVGLVFIVFVFCFSLNATVVHADNPLQVSVHSAPPRFYEFLLMHDESGELFDSSGEWVPGEAADLVVIFVKDKNDFGLAPANWVQVFQVIVPKVNSHVYHIPKNSLETPMDSQVVLFLVENLHAFIKELDVGLAADLEVQNKFLSCFSAGLVVGQLTDASWVDGNLGNAIQCKGWLAVGG